MKQRAYFLRDTLLFQSSNGRHEIKFISQVCFHLVETRREIHEGRRSEEEHTGAAT